MCELSILVNHVENDLNPRPHLHHFLIPNQSRTRKKEKRNSTRFLHSVVQGDKDSPFSHQKKKKEKDIEIADTWETYEAIKNHYLFDLVLLLFVLVRL